jgi:hypothetical protein
MEAKTLSEIAEAKANDRRERAKRPFVDKIRALVRMQQRRAAILKLSGKTSRIWDIEL